MAFSLQARIKHYDWGARGALSRVVGLESSSRREAEIWWGNHPLAACSIDTPDGVTDFSLWLEENRVTFPLLVKLLAAQRPLSIQVHPDQLQAQRGFADEQAQNIPLDAWERTYKDQSSKPELLLALSDEFVGLAGFVTETTIRDRLTRWGHAGLPQTLLSLMDGLAANAQEASRMITLQLPPTDSLIRELDDWLVSVDSSVLDKQTAKELRLLQRISATHPNDAGILFAFLMHHIYLRRGEALFVAAGDVHAYLEGFGLEVMLPSDNVIRAGLTSKHKDTAAFLELSNFTMSSGPRLVYPAEENFVATYGGFEADFAVRCVRFGAAEFVITRPSVCFIEFGDALVENSGAKIVNQGATVFALPGERLTPHSEDAVVWVVYSTKD